MQKYITSMPVRFLLITLLVMLHTIPGWSQRSIKAYGNEPSAGKYADIRGIKMYYETYGEGDPLLIIHGNGGSIRDFTNQIPFFEEHYKVILADNRSQGKTLDDKDSLSYEMMADDLAALLTSLHLDSCFVIGWSDGGIEGLLLTMRHPEKVKKLAITGANLWPDTTAVDPWVYQFAKHLNDSLDLVQRDESNRVPKKLLHLLTYEPHLRTTDLGKISCPVLVMGGDYDVIRPEHTLLIARSIPRSYLWILPNSGHSTPIVYKDIFNQTVYDFFRFPFRKIAEKDRFR